MKKPDRQERETGDQGHHEVPSLMANLGDAVPRFPHWMRAISRDSGSHPMVPAEAALAIQGIEHRRHGW